MGHPYNHKAFPVALYDPILAELTYKLRNLDASEGEAAKLFPDASKFREASEEFCRKAASRYEDEKDRSVVTFKWLKAVFDDKCEEQVHVPKPPSKGAKAIATKSAKASGSGKSSDGPTAGAEASDSSKGSGRSYARPDGAVASKAGSPPVGDEGEVIVGGVKTKAGQSAVLSILIEIKTRFGDAIMQSVKVSARHLHALEVRSPVRLCDCASSDNCFSL